MAEFRILVFVTDTALYDVQRASFEAGGFVPPDAVWQVVDNTRGNTGDPYTVVNELLDSMAEPKLIVCHQDVRLADGTTIASMRAELDRADRLHPGWGVAGPAGLDLRYCHVAVVDDPWHTPRWPGPWPVRAEVLDELLLIMRPGRVRLTDGLSGFHFFAADLCVAARRLGGDALVVNIPVVHLSDGEGGRTSADYRAARDALQEALSPAYRFRVLMAITSEAMVLSRYQLVQRLADRRRIRQAAVRLLGRRMVP